MSKFGRRRVRADGVSARCRRDGRRPGARQHRPLRALGLAVGLALAVPGVNAGTAAAAQTFTDVQPGATWTVPVGVTSIEATVTGAAGGGGGTVTFPVIGFPIGSSGDGGPGAAETVTIPVQAGEVLDFDYGSLGGGPGGAHSPGAGGSGWASGGDGNTGSLNGEAGGGGGGASAIVDATGGTLVVAGGGGGAGGPDADVDAAGNGGPAGVVGPAVPENAEPTGFSGSSGDSPVGVGGNGGAGGPAGLGSGQGGSGGEGGNAASSSSSGGGGGGGGGSESGAGGGGGQAGEGSGGGGGGGASFVDTNDGVVVDGAGFNGAAGNITISYTQSELTTINVTSSSNPSSYGNTVTLSAAVTDTTDPTQTPSGTLTVSEGSTTLGTATLDSNGDASFTAPGTVGAHNLSFSYTPTADTVFGASSTSFIQNVAAAAVTVTAISSDPSATAAAPPTISVLVAAAQPGLSGVPDGTVTAVQNGQLLSTATLDADGVATFPDLVATAGSHNLQFEYDPASNSDFASGRGQLIQQIVAAPVTLTPSSNDPAATTANPPTLSVLVAPEQPGLPVPTGTVTASENGTTLSTAVVDSNGVATFPDLITSAGTDELTFSYAPASSSPYATASVPFAQTVAAASVPAEAVTVTAVSSHRYPLYGGARPQFSVAVSAAGSAASAAPSGTVVAYRNGTRVGSAVIGTNGAATFTNLVVRPGKYQMEFTYVPAAGSPFAAGDASYVQIMRPAPVEVGSSAASHTAVYGSAAPLTVTVKPREHGVSPAPAGTITVTEATATASKGAAANARARVLAVKRLTTTGGVTFRGLPATVGVEHLKFTYTPSAWAPYRGGTSQRYEIVDRAAVKLTLATSDPRSPLLLVRVGAARAGVSPAPAGRLVITLNGRTVKDVRVTAGGQQPFRLVPTRKDGSVSRPVAGSYRFAVRFVPAKGSPYSSARASLLERVG
jgi:Bacterial Ig-like domain (group 3)